MDSNTKCNFHYRPHQANLLAKKCSEQYRNARKNQLDILNQAFELIKIQWSPEQISSKLLVNDESIYHHIYKDDQCNDTTWQALRCYKKKRKHCGSERNKRKKILEKGLLQKNQKLLKNAHQ